MKTGVMNEKGQFLIFVTLAFVLLGLFLGLAIDLGRGYLLKARLSRVVDAATLAAAKALKGQIGFQDEAVKAACDAMLMNGMKIAMNEDGTCGATGETNFTLSVNFVDKVVSGGPPMRFVEITGTASIPTTFMRLAKLFASGNFDTLTVSAFAEGGPERPVDLMLILDRSRSMVATDSSGTTKIDALKTTIDAFLSNTFTENDQVGMTSFAFRGCADGSGGDFKGAECKADVALGSDIVPIKQAVSKLVAVGPTNTMEALLVAKDEMTKAFADESRNRTRKAVLLVTDGQPTFMRRFTDCERTPRKNFPLPAGFFPNGCLFGVHSTFFDRMLRSTPSNPESFENITDVPGCTGPCLYKEVIASTRDITNGAMAKANEIRALDGDGDGKGDVVIFAIAIGKPEPDSPQSSLDANAKCLLARIANDPSTISECNNVPVPTIDGDMHSDLLESWPCASSPCIDETQQRGKVFTVDLNGNVRDQLKAIFEQIAALLKLRLTI